MKGDGKVGDVHKSSSQLTLSPAVVEVAKNQNYVAVIKTIAEKLRKLVVLLSGAQQN